MGNTFSVEDDSEKTEENTEERERAQEPKQPKTRHRRRRKGSTLRQKMKRAAVQHDDSDNPETVN
jgi:hypothetical protein